MELKNTQLNIKTNKLINEIEELNYKNKKNKKVLENDICELKNDIKRKENINKSLT